MNNTESQRVCEDKESDVFKELTGIYEELTPYAGVTGLTKMLSGCSGLRGDWHVTRVSFSPFPYAVVGWYVHAQCGNSSQTLWTHITPDEIWTCRLKYAQFHGIYDDEAARDHLRKYAEEHCADKEYRENMAASLTKKYEEFRENQWSVIEALGKTV